MATCKCKIGCDLSLGGLFGHRQAFPCFRGARYAASILLLSLFSLLSLIVCPGAVQAHAAEVAGQTAQEFSVLRQQLLRNPNDVAAMNSLGILYARMGQLQDAILLWQRALAINPNYVHLYNNLGSAFKTLGRTEEAIAVFRTGLGISPSYWMYFNLGLVYREKKKIAEAVRCFQYALTMNREFAPATRQLLELGYPAVPQNLSVVNAPIAPIAPIAPHISSSLENSFTFKPPVVTGDISFPASQRPTVAKEVVVSSPTIPRKLAPKATAIPATPLTTEDCVRIIGKIQAPSLSKLVALTFDDGPHAELTARLLDYLAAERIRATFFVVGLRADRYHTLVRRMAHEGHEVGNHTWKHSSLVKLGREAAVADLHKTATLLSGITGKPCTLVRPPFGHTNAVIQSVFEQNGWRQVLWDTDSRDWQLKNPQAVLHRVLRGFAPGSIVLFHDIHPGMLEVLPILVPALKACGYRFVTVPELLILTSSSTS